jgi:hypothetical protein
MNEQPDAAWRLRWVQSKDGLEIEAWAVGEKGYKIGSISTRITDRNPEIKEAFMALMKRPPPKPCSICLVRTGLLRWSICNERGAHEPDREADTRGERHAVESAWQALSAAVTIDEVKHVLDRSVALVE